MPYNPEYNKKYFANRKGKIVTERKEKRARLRIRLIEIFGSKCNICGFSDSRALQIDHIKGGGTQERKSVNGAFRSQYFLDQAETDIENFLSKYQLLCANCNWIKRFKNDEFRKPFNRN